MSMMLPLFNITLHTPGAIVLLSAVAGTIYVNVYCKKLSLVNTQQGSTSN